jgi:GR25 family glycosyltransferase involved in LPS biosynthesis
MKTFIIHIKGNANSEKTAGWAYDSCIENGYEPELFDAVTPKTLKEFDKKYNLTVLKPSHMYDRQIGKNGSKHTYECKYSVFLSHYTLWNKCVELDEPIIILEHDALALRPWGDTKFDELLFLNMHSGLYQNIFDDKPRPELFKGVHTYINPFLIYRAENIWHGAGLIPGAASYAISPKGAKRIISNVEKYGWDKPDYIINTKIIRVQYSHPDHFQFSHHLFKNQRTTHGEF